MAKCSFHSDKEAVEKCTICGKDMCERCAPKYVNERVACPVCAKEGNKRERNGYIWITALIGFGILLAVAVVTLLVLLIVREKSENLIRNVGFSIVVVAVLGFAIFMLIKSIESLKYYNSRYKIAIEYEKTAPTTTDAEPEKEAAVTTTTETASKKATPKKATTTAKKSEAKAEEKKPSTAKKVATKTAAKPAEKTVAAKATTTAKTTTVKSTASKKATTTATKKEEKPVEKKATTTAKSKSTTAKKAAVKKSTTTK